MKRVFLSLSVSFICLVAFSQNREAGSEFSIGLDGALPLGGWSEQSQKLYSAGLGGSIKYAYNFDESVALTLQSGYLNFFGKNVTISDETTTVSGKMPNFHQIPIKAGVRYSMSQFYVEPQLGVSFIGYSGYSTSAFTYAGNIGVLATPSFDISLRYEGMSKNGTSSFLGLRLAYIFPSGK